MRSFEEARKLVQDALGRQRVRDAAENAGNCFDEIFERCEEATLDDPFWHEGSTERGNCGQLHAADPEWPALEEARRPRGKGARLMGGVQQ